MNLLEIDTNGKALAALTKAARAFDPREVKAKMRKIMEVEVIRLRDHIRKTQLNDFSSRSSGRLSRSLEGRVRDVGGILEVSVGVFKGAAMAYAGVQDQGTKSMNSRSPYPKRGSSITSNRPKPSALAIPTDAAFRANGQLRSRRDLVYVPKRKKTGNTVGFLVKPIKGMALSLSDATIFYILVKKVDIKPRFYLSKGLRSYMPRLTRNLEAAIVKHLGAE